jgi:hypothetical protein
MLLVTTSLLNSWLYIWKASEENTDKAYAEFVDSLQKVAKPANEAMLLGIAFEDDCIAGKVAGISEVIEGGAFQYKAKKEIKVDNHDVLLYGKIDVLKAGIIYDIKRTSKYETNKYFDSMQHHMYLTMIPEATEFHYLANDGNNTYWESYSRDDLIDLVPVIRNFFDWLKNYNLWGIYQTHWSARKEK